MAQSSATVTKTRARGYAPITIRAGEDFTIDLEINVLAGTDENLAGDDLTWYMRRQGSKINALKKTESDGITITGESTGVATVTINSADTDHLDPGVYHHQLWLKDSSGDYELILAGTIRLQKQLGFGSQSNAFEES